WWRDCARTRAVAQKTGERAPSSPAGPSVAAVRDARHRDLAREACEPDPVPPARRDGRPALAQRIGGGEARDELERRRIGDAVAVVLAARRIAERGGNGRGGIA